MHRLARFSLAHRALTALVTVAVALLGVVSLGSLRQELIPSISFPAAAVIGVYPGASPQVVEQQVTTIVEGAVLGVDGVDQVTSTSSSSLSATTVMFRYGTNVTTAVAELRGALENAASQLPDDVDPQVLAGSLDDLPVVQLAVSGGDDTAALQKSVDEVLVPELEDVANVRTVAVTGAPERLITVDVDLQAMGGLGVTPADVLDVLERNGVRLPAGTLTDGEQTLSVQVGTPITSVEELQGLPVMTTGGGTVALSDFATVVDGEAAATSFSRLNGDPSLAVAITKTPDGNVVEVSRAVTQVLDDLADRLDAQGVDVTVVFDQAPFITESIEGLATEGGLGLVFAVLVILLFLASWRSTLVSAVSIPLSLLVAFSIMKATGYTLNLLTLAALTIAIGRVVDDSIVVIENISRHLSYGEERKAAVLGAVREVGGAITASTLATVAVFAPIGFVGGFVGELFRPFAFTVAIAMGASLFVALTIVPVLAYWFVKNPVLAHDDAEGARLREEAEAKERHGLWQRGYLPLLAASLRRPVVTLLVAVGVLVGTLGLTPLLETNLIGDSGQDTVTVSAKFEPGTSLAAQSASAETVEDALMDVDGVATVQTSGGQGSGFEAFTGGAGNANFAVTFDEGADNERVSDDIRAAVQDLDTAPITQLTVAAGSAGFGSSTVDLVVSADDADTLAEAAEQVQAEAEKAPDGDAVSSTLAADQPVVQVTVDRAAAAAAGLTETGVATTVAGLMNDPKLGTVDLGDGPVSVVASFGEPPADIEALKSTVLATPTGGVLLAEVADVQVVETQASITRTDGRRTVTVSVTPAGQDVGALSADLTARMAALDLPQGADVVVAGVAADQADAFGDLGLALLLAIAIVYIVLVATFNSLGQPLILLVSIPFAATGALAGLLLTGTPLGVPALIGMLMLVGIVVSNAVVLIDLINQYRTRGRPLDDAVAEGARKRLRPIVMTAAATIFALLPMAFGITGGGAFISRPLAIVVIGGLITSTLLTLVVVPVIYTLTERRKARRHDKREAKREAQREAQREAKREAKREAQREAATTDGGAEPATA